MAGEWGDLISMDFEPQDEQQDYSNYSFEMPDAGWSFGQNLGGGMGVSDPMAGYSFEMPEAGWSMGQNLNALPTGGELGMDWGSIMPEVSNPISTSDAIRSAGTPAYTSTPGMSDLQDPAQSIASTMTPTVGQQGAQGGLGQEDDIWKKLMKSGLGLGVSALGTGISSLVNSAMQPSSKSGSNSPLVNQAPASATPASAPAPAGNSYQMPAYTPPPGAQWSPNISGQPTSVKLSPGLVTADRMKKGGSTGGFSMY